MQKAKLVFVCIAVSFIAMIVISCKKETNNSKNASASRQALVPITGTMPAPPNIKEGVMEFPNHEELNVYLNYLDQVQAQYSEDDADVDIDSLLKTIEDGFSGFTSLRQHELNTYSSIDAEGETIYDYETLNTNTVTGYASLKSVLNENKEVYVENNLVIYLDNESQVVVQSPELVQTVRDLVVSTTDKELLIEKLRDLQSDYFGSESVSVMSAIYIPPTTDPSGGLLNSDVYFDACAKKVTIKNIHSSTYGHPCRFYEEYPVINVSWGDGSTDQFNQNNTSYATMWFASGACDNQLINRKIRSKSNTYPNSVTGVRILTISTPTHPNAKQYTLDFDNNCTKVPKEEDAYTAANGNTDVLYARLEVINGFLTHRVVAQSISYRRKLDQSLVKEKSQISTKVIGQIKNNSCSVSSNVNTFERWANSKSATITVGNGASNDLYFTEFNSEHKRKARNNENMAINLKLKACDN